MHYSAWKYILIVVVLVVSGLYALPNLYPDESAVQITSASAGTTLTKETLTHSETLLTQAGLSHHDGEFFDNSALIRLSSPEDQLKAQEVLRRELGENYVVALNLAPTTPQWLSDIGAKPMKLGLDLRGGVRFVLEVDTKKALEQRLKTLNQEIRRNLRSNKIDISTQEVLTDGVLITFGDTAARNLAQTSLQNTLGNVYVMRPMPQKKRLSRSAATLTPSWR